MVAQDEAVTRILQLNKKFDTVMVYPAFGNEVSKAKALNSSESPPTLSLADLMLCLEKGHHLVFCKPNVRYACAQSDAGR